MMKQILRIVVLAGLLLALMVTPGTAASVPLDVQIIGTLDLSNYPNLLGTFTASGPAVDAGLFCASGTQADLDNDIHAIPSPKVTIFHVRKQLTCNDGSGTILLNLVAQYDQRANTANWNVLRGTGAYANLHGEGKLYAVFNSDFTIINDYYSGKLH